MGIELFTAPPDVAQETMRERAVEASGMLQLGASPELQALVEEAARSFGTAMAAGWAALGVAIAMLAGAMLAWSCLLKP